MKHFNKNQKVVFFISLLVFMLVVCLSLSLVLGNSIKKLTSKSDYSINLYDNNKIVETKSSFGQEHSLTNSQIVINSSQIKIAAIGSNISFILNENSFVPSSGLYFILEADDGFEFKINDKSYSIKSDFVGILNSKDKSVIILEGIFDKYTESSLIELDILKEYNFNRNDFEKVTELKTMYDFLKSNNLIPNYLKDLTAPEIKLLNNSRETVSSETYKIAGSTDSESTVSVNGENVDVDSSGDFSLTINLKTGINEIEIIATDENGNKSVEYIIVTLELLPLSFPLSYTQGI